MNFDLKIENEKFRGSIEVKDDRYIISTGEKQYEVQSQFVDENTVFLQIANQTYLIHIQREDKRLLLAYRGRIYEAQEVSEDGVRSSIDHAVANVLTAPMPGLVVKVNVGPGDAVEKNQILAIVEAMKMENQLRSPMPGKVKKVLVKAGDKVDANQLLIELEEKNPAQS